MRLGAVYWDMHATESLIFMGKPPFIECGPVRALIAALGEPVPKHGFAFGKFQLRFTYFIGLTHPQVGFILRKNS